MTIGKFATALALVLASSASLASDPPAPATAATPAAAAAPSPAASATAAAPAASSTAAIPDSDAAATAKAADDRAATAKGAHALGYVPKQRNGKLVYCKPEAALGTRLQTMSCFSEEEMTAVIRRNVENQDSLARIQRTELYQEGKQ